METKKFPIEEIQKQLRLQEGLDGWLIYDFRGHNGIAIEVLGIDPELLLSRRCFYWIPKQGQPLKIIHRIESHLLSHLPGDQIIYESWKSLELALNSTLKGQRRICLEYSPKGAIPVISKLDAGTFEFLLDKKIEVVSSWPIAKHFVARWSSKQLKQHQEASKILIGAYKSAWSCVQQALKNNKTIFETDVQEHILDYLHRHGLITDHAPIVAIGPHSALPHYVPSKNASAPIESNSLLLIDLWGKQSHAGAPYADITQVIFTGASPPEEMKSLYGVVKLAQNRSIEFLKQRLAADKEIYGYEVDDICRSVIQEAGYGAFFIHRTGHNIHTDLHGLGPNLDNYETNDSRPLMPRTCYSIEPGIYLPGSFGIRLECNVFIKEDRTLLVTGRSPPELPCLGGT